MNLSLPKHYNRKIARTIAEFELIEAGDKILVGLSGGKDSSFLLYALAVFQKYLGVNFDLAALTVDLGFTEEVDYTPLREFCAQLEVPYYVEETRIAEAVQAEGTNNPCAKCSYFRRGAIGEFMEQTDHNKIAYGHHYDDAVETFLMSIIYSGQIKTFEPKSYLSRQGIYVIRPLVYMREQEIVEANSQLLDWEPLASSCPYDGTTKRAEIKELIGQFTDDKQIFYNLASAMREGTEINLWPEELSGEEIARRLSELWGN